jgi:hypothetical protein
MFLLARKEQGLAISGVTCGLKPVSDYVKSIYYVKYQNYTDLLLESSTDKTSFFVLVF